MLEEDNYLSGENKHWSYCINGNDFAIHYAAAVMIHVPAQNITTKTSASYILEQAKLLLNKPENFKKIYGFISDYESRLPFLIFGTMIIGMGADLPEEFRRDLLDFSDWEKYEEEQLREEEYSYLRKGFLLEFHEMVETYKNGSARMVTYETYIFTCNKYHFKHELTPIDYSLKEIILHL